MLKLFHKNPNNAYDSSIRKKSEGFLTPNSSMNKVLSIRNFGKRKRSKINQPNLSPKETSPELEIRPKRNINLKRNNKFKNFNLSSSNFGQYTKEKRADEFKEKLNNMSFYKNLKQEESYNMSELYNQRITKNIKSEKCRKQLCSSVDSKLFTSTDLAKNMPRKEYPEGTTNDAIFIMKNKRKYLDKLPINEEDKMAILKHHLQKKGIKNSRIKKVIFNKKLHQPFSILRSHTKNIKKFDFRGVGASPLPRKTLFNSPLLTKGFGLSPFKKNSNILQNSIMSKFQNFDI